MSHDFNYRIGATALVPTYANAVRLIEGIAGKRADMLEAAYRHGAYVADRHWNRAKLMALDVGVGDGTPTQIYTALQTLTRLFASGVPTLTRNDPVGGDVRCRILVADPVDQPEGSSRFLWRWPVWQIDGYWEEVAQTSEVDTGLTTSGSIGPFTPNGTMETEPVFTITCQSAGIDPTVSNAANGDQITVAGSYSASDVIVVNVPDRTVTVNGTRSKNALVVNRGYWMAFEPGVATTLTWSATSGTWDVTTAWRERYR